MDNNSTLAKEFFACLSERMYNENRLSDITWALCQVSDNFKYSFVKFFFEDIKKEDCREIEIEREKQQDIGRPDFYFEFDNKVFLIENKIKDPNHHFHQYLQTCKEPSYLGYITNYVIKDEDDINDNGNIIKWKELYNEGFRVHTWEEFCDNYAIDEQTCWIDDCSDIHKYQYLPNYKTLDARNDKFTFNNQQTAEAFIALAQLLMLRNEYVGNWEADWDDKTQTKYCVTDKIFAKLSYSTLYSRHPLSFPTEKLAREFKKNFQDLLNKASMLI